MTQVSNVPQLTYDIYRKVCKELNIEQEFLFREIKDDANLELDEILGYISGLTVSDDDDIMKHMSTVESTEVWSEYVTKYPYLS